MFIMGVNGKNKPLRELIHEFGDKPCGDLPPWYHYASMQLQLQLQFFKMIFLGLRNNKKAWRYRCKWGLNVESFFVNFSSTIVTFHDVTFLDVAFVRGYFLYKKSGVVNWYLYQCQKTAVEPPTLGLFSKFPGFVLQYISKWLFGFL